jgi:Cu+-exporting ATPase
MPAIAKEIRLTCFHCGERCPNDQNQIADKFFCCEGCQLVFTLLDKSGMCEYYQLSSNPGQPRKIKIREGKFAFLDDKEVKSKLLSYQDGNQAILTLYLPQMHCSSCIWLLENLNKLDSGVISSRVDFPKKELLVAFNEKTTSVRKVAELLTEIGYEPHINLNDLDEKKIHKTDRKRIIRLGVAGFCFGNIMMLSLPEYFSTGSLGTGLDAFFTYLTLLLALPVFFFSAGEFYLSAWKGIRKKFLNIDVPIVLAIGITFSRSLYDIISGKGTGYLDSMSGIVFFMLAGRVFQDYTHQALSFERDYKSYFPISVTLKTGQEEKEIPISNLKVGDRVIIRNQELIPADGILLNGKASIDYSFVTGESAPVSKNMGEIIYAGGRQCGSIIELQVVKDVSHSYLTQLWNKEVFKEPSKKKQSFIHTLSINFTWGLLLFAAIVSIYWSIFDSSRIFNALTSVLIVACPCALLLSATFTNGNILRILGKKGLYLKNAGVIEQLASSDTIVFDKTGTLTETGASSFRFIGETLDQEAKEKIHTLARQSSHPLSKVIADSLSAPSLIPVNKFREIPGHGSEGAINGTSIRLGTIKFAGGQEEEAPDGSTVHLSLGNTYRGYFSISNFYRKSLPGLVRDLKRHYKLHVLSGDNSAEKHFLRETFGSEGDLRFEQRPDDKLSFIFSLQADGKRVIMVGDGLNDAGALKQSEVGIAVSEDLNKFSPACDAILSSKHFANLAQFLEFSRLGKKIILSSFVISVLYNIVGLTFAAKGMLSPVMAAILMPLSSISILLFTTGISAVGARYIFKRQPSNT